MSNAKPIKATQKKNNKFVGWPKCKKYGYKQLADQICKHANRKFDKYHKKEHISRFNNSYISVNKEKIA